MKILTTVCVEFFSYTSIKEYLKCLCLQERVLNECQLAFVSTMGLIIAACE